MTTRAVVNRLLREGWAERSGEGKLVVLTNSGSGLIVVPQHGGNIPKGALRSICRAAGWVYPPRAR